MPTYCVNATDGFDCLHFLVKGNSFQDARKKVIDTCQYKTHSYIKKVVESKSTDIIDFSIDENDLEFGYNSFEVDEYSGTIDVLDNDSNRMRFETLEEAKEFINEIDASGYVVNTYGGWTLKPLWNSPTSDGKELKLL